jgi:tetratricopeptide (TPR) repeat protein
MLPSSSSSSSSLHTIDGSKVVPFESKDDDGSVHSSSGSNASLTSKKELELDDEEETEEFDGDSYDFQNLLANKKSGKIFEIDYIGGDTFRVSQTNLLKIKSIEPYPDAHALLSARGLTHRSSETFKKELRAVTQIIGGTKIAAGTTQPTHLFQPYFQRALAYERLSQVNKAIKDYTHCIQIKPTFSEAYFNRSGLYQLKGKSDAAIKDLNEAIRLEPLNANYRRNRSLLLRETGE